MNDVIGLRLAFGNFFEQIGNCDEHLLAGEYAAEKDALQPLDRQPELLNGNFGKDGDVLGVDARIQLAAVDAKRAAEFQQVTVQLVDNILVAQIQCGLLVFDWQFKEQVGEQLEVGFLLRGQGHCVNEQGDLSEIGSLL